ncbi:17509_t:CDS:1, partial [Acaulospora colombiana]
SYSALATVGEHDTFSGGISGEYPLSGKGSMAGGEMANGQLMSAGPMGGKGHVPLRDVGEEMEVRDAEGRYRHARRAPVDEFTLQPIRRVSKAGLETTWEGKGL